MSQEQAYNRMIASLTRSVMLLMSIAVVVFVFTSASEAITSNEGVELAVVDAPTDGAILGSIISEDDAFKITLTNEETSVSRNLDATGDYFFKGFEPGIYNITIQSSNDDSASITIKDVAIATGEVTALGVHEL